MFEYKKNDNLVPVKVWSDQAIYEKDSSLVAQVDALAKFPYAYNHIAIMPDYHFGYGMPIGGVLATTEVVIPNAVGVDIGCGVTAIKSNLKIADFSKTQLAKVVEQVRAQIPVGFKKHKKNVKWERFEDAPDIPVIKANLRNARKQLGTLGGGNHFCEFQKDQDGFIWIMIHSGSRNFGLKIASFYNELAKKMQPKAIKDLAYLHFDAAEGQEYLAAMNFALEFARENRRLMLAVCCSALQSQIDCQFEEPIDIHHNYAALEEHFGQEVMVHRKGATLAAKGQTGIIPGSQGTASYIVEGLGNKDAFCSCSHGAGRLMSRGAAIRNLDLEQEIKKLDQLGVMHSISKKGDLDEATSAYKDIDMVMADQTDLVKIINKLSPLAVIKG